MFRQQFWVGLADGSVTLAFRRWKRPMVRAGGRQTTPAGVLAIDDVRVIDEQEITDEDARRSGFADPAALFAELAGREGQLYRIDFHLAGEDPRIALPGRASRKLIWGSSSLSARVGSSLSINAMYSSSAMTRSFW